MKNFLHDYYTGLKVSVRVACAFPVVGMYFFSSQAALSQITSNANPPSPGEIQLQQKLELNDSAQIQQQESPNEDRLLQPTPFPSPLPSDPAPPDVEADPSPITPDLDSERFLIERVEVIGSSVFEESDFAAVTEPLEGQVVTQSELIELVNEVTQLYLRAGYITSRAVLVEEALESGVAQIQVIEGRLTEIQVEGLDELNEDYVRSRIEVAVGDPLNKTELENQLRLLQTDPLIKNIGASLRTGAAVGESILVVRVSEAVPYNAIAYIDNYSPPSVGGERFGATAFHGNLTGMGDRLLGAFTRTFAGGAESLELSYRVPVNAMDGTVQARALINRTEVIQEPFDTLDIEGESELYEISYRQPLIRTPNEELALSIGFAYEDGQTFTFAGPTPFGFGPNEEGETTTSVIKLGQEYIRRDNSGAWGVRSLFSIGTGLFDATSNDDPVPDGKFVSWLGQVQRLQVITPNNFLIIEAGFQLTPDPLLPSQQFIIGGGQSVRGYRQNVRAADNGFRLSIEDRIILDRNKAGDAIWQIAPFFDAGAIFNAEDNPNSINQNQTFIAGIGLGILWQPIDRLNLRFDYGYPLIDIEDRGDNIQDDGLYFSVTYSLND